jgi:prepilin signal peptidase PulO-like enzyme (type II secretory pathway)
MPWRTQIPFGPYMVGGAIAVVLLYPQLAAVWQAWIGLIAPG